MENYIAIELPSKCLAYEGVDAASIQVRGLKGKDEKLIAEMTAGNANKKFVSVLKNVLKGVDPVKLTLGDRKFILMWLTVNSYGPRYVETIVCDECLGKHQVEVDLASIEVKELPLDFVQPVEKELSGGKKIHLRLLTVADELAVDSFESSGKVSGWLYRYALSLVDDKMDMGAKINFLEELPVGDLAVIRAFHEEVDHGPDMKVNYVCSDPECGHAGRIILPFRVDMVFRYGEALQRFVRQTV